MVHLSIRSLVLQVGMCLRGLTDAHVAASHTHVEVEDLYIPEALGTLFGVQSKRSGDSLVFLVTWRVSQTDGQDLPTREFKGLDQALQWMWEQCTEKTGLQQPKQGNDGEQGCCLLIQWICWTPY